MQKLRNLTVQRSKIARFFLDLVLRKSLKLFKGFILHTFSHSPLNRIKNQKRRNLEWLCGTWLCLLALSTFVKVFDPLREIEHHEYEAPITATNVGHEAWGTAYEINATKYTIILCVFLFHLYLMRGKRAKSSQTKIYHI